jgi:hypothetical protein
MSTNPVPTARIQTTAPESQNLAPVELTAASAMKLHF